jgi:hypothetical protein
MVESRSGTASHHCIKLRWERELLLQCCAESAAATEERGGMGDEVPRGATMKGAAPKYPWLCLGMAWALRNWARPVAALELNFLGPFGRRVHPRVINKTRAQTGLCVSLVRVRPTGVKLHWHPLGQKLMDHSKTEPELPSLPMCSGQPSPPSSSHHCPTPPRMASYSFRQARSSSPSLVLLPIQASSSWPHHYNPSLTKPFC